MADLTTTSLDHSEGWDWENQHVNQSYTIGGKSADAIAHDIVESGTVLICAAPASMSTVLGATSNYTGGAGSVGGVRIVPIGMVEQASVAQSKPLSRIFEIGSKLSYIIPGRTVGQIALARVLFDGPSLLKCLYQGEVYQDEQLADGTKRVTFSTQQSATLVQSSPDKQGKGGFAPIGSGNFAMNLASTFFDQKTGLVFFFRDRQSDAVSTMYFEGCLVSTHSLGISAGMNVITESVSIEFVRAVPVIVAEAHPQNYVTAEQKTDGKLYDIPIIGIA